MLLRRIQITIIQSQLIAAKARMTAIQHQYTPERRLHAQMTQAEIDALEDALFTLQKPDIPHPIEGL